MSESGRTLRAGVIGLGVGSRHAMAYAAHPQCEVKAVCDFDMDLAQRVAGEFDGCDIAPDADGMVSNPDIDVVSVASYDNYHADQIVAAIEAGKHVMAEKPFCLNRQEADRIAKALKRNPQVRFSSNFVLRASTLFANLRDSVRRGEYGQVYHMEADYLWGRLAKVTEGWRAQMDFYSIIHGAAIHMIDLVSWVKGELPVSVSAVGSDACSRGSSLKYNDFAMITALYEDGSTAKFSAHAGSVHKHFHGVRLYGTDRTFMHDAAGSRVWSGSEPDAWETPEGDYPATEKGLVIGGFVDSILGLRQDAPVTCRDSFDAMAVCLAAQQSMETGKPCVIDYGRI